MSVGKYWVVIYHVFLFTSALRRLSISKTDETRHTTDMLWRFTNICRHRSRQSNVVVRFLQFWSRAKFKFSTRLFFVIDDPSDVVLVRSSPLLKGEGSPNKIVSVFLPSNMTGDRANSNKARWRLPRLSSHRLGVILIVLSFVWGMYLIRIQINDRKSQSEFLKAKIIALSKEYIDAVAKEKGLTAVSDVDNGKN